MMKEKRLYQSPTTRRDVVELEDGFCGSITNTTEVETTRHETGYDQSWDADFGGVADDNSNTLEWK